MSKHCKFFKYTLDSNEEVVNLQKIPSDIFKHVIAFLDNRKLCDPKDIPSPLNNNKNFDSMVEKCDADLVNKIFSEGYSQFEKTLNAASFLQMESFLKLLYARIAMEFIGKDIDKLK